MLQPTVLAAVSCETRPSEVLCILRCTPGHAWGIDDFAVERENGMSVNVVGAWHGWKGKTVVKLTDGSVWVQAEYHYEYFYAFRPGRTSSGTNFMSRE